MKENDNITWCLDDAFAAVRLIALIDHKVIPNTVDKGGTKVSLDPFQRRVFIAVSLLSEFSPSAKEIDGIRVEIGATFDEIAVVTELLEEYEDGKKLDVIGPLVSLIRKGDVSSLVQKK